MSDGTVSIGVYVNDSQALAQLQSYRKAVDAQVKEWRAQRQVMIHELSQIQQGIGLLVRAIRMTAEATGTALDPLQNALLGLVSSTTSLIISTAIALTAGSLGILTGVALGMAAFAYGMEIAHTAKLLADFKALRESMGEVQMKMSNLERGYQMRGMFGGL